MKKLFFGAFIAVLSMTSCSDEGQENNETTLLKTHYILYHSQSQKIQGTNVENADWLVDDDFVASVSGDTVTGGYVGKTNVCESQKGICFTVEVLPKYSLYKEPDMDWGASKSTIQSRYGTPLRTTTDGLIYNSSNTNVPYYIYLFNSNGLYCSGVVVKTSSASMLANFLMERYLTYNVDMSSYKANFMHCTGKISEPKMDYAIQMSYSASLGGILVVYVPAVETKCSRENMMVKIEDFLVDSKIEQ